MIRQIADKLDDVTMFLKLFCHSNARWDRTCHMKAATFVACTDLESRDKVSLVHGQQVLEIRN